MKVPDSAVQISGDTLTIHLVDVPVVDAFTFPPPLPPPPENGISPVTLIPARVSFDITYTKSGKPRHVHPTSSDPLSPFTWAGEMWMATNSGSFSVTYSDNSFSAGGNFSSAGNFGEMGTERNGSFAREETDKAALRPWAPNQAHSTASPWTSVTEPDNGPKLKGRVAIKN